MSNTSDIVSRIEITFNDGSVIELVDTHRFHAIRNALKVASETNRLLNKQLELMEDKIRNLESKNKELDNIIQTEFMDGVAVTDNPTYGFGEPFNPLP